MHDAQLLREYAASGSEAAFARLVDQYLPLVYSVSHRETGDACLAQDATQMVFLLLARKAATIGSGVVLSGWLFNAARYTARNLRRQETRRRRYEQEAFVASMTSDEDRLWSTIEPNLHDAIAALSARDRDAVLLRFFEGRSLREIGSVLGVSEGAAKVRLSRALDKLRRRFAAEGIVVTAVLLAALLSARAVKAAPDGTAALVLRMVNNAAGLPARTGRTSLRPSLGVKPFAFLTGLAILALVAGWSMHPLWDLDDLARQNNGSRRTSIRNASLSPAARQLVTAYHRDLYPLLRRFVRQRNHTPATLDEVSGMAEFLAQDGEWHLPAGFRADGSKVTGFRLDGTRIHRPVYIDDPFDAPHDPWLIHRVAGPDGTAYIVGWDDGEATYEPMSGWYIRILPLSGRPAQLVAPPGAAGIPPGTPRTGP